MDAALYERASAIFLQACDLPADLRESFLEEACSGNPPLHAFVRELLRHDSAPSAPVITAASDPQVGERIRNYRLERLLGEGGMGLVYLAWQLEPVRRLVALKVMRAGLDTKSLLLRFDKERHVLALMDHPHIAKVFDAGVTESGRPFFVMEFVPGVPITTYCDQNRLDIPQRLALFCDVCHAIQHAHQKAVLHRDIKPSNVLVAEIDGKPVPKVIDFGIAKALEQAEEEETLLTRHGMILGTPEYMSPEQAACRPVDTQTDVYSLGALLYELLVGRRPFEKTDLGEPTFESLRHAIASSDPRKPSTVARERGATVVTERGIDPGTLQRDLRADLDWVVLKAIEKDRDRRYPSVAELAADIGRYLAREPVVARPPTAAYLARKYIRRHRVLVITTASVVAALIAGTCATIWQARRAADRLDRMQNVSRQLVSRFYDLADQAGGIQTKRTLAALATVTLDDLARRRDLTIDEHRQLAGSYEALAQVQGDAYSSSIGDVLGARNSLLTAYPHRLRVYASDTTNVTFAREMVKVCYVRASVHQGDPAVDGKRLLERGIAIGDRFLAKAPDPTMLVLVSTSHELLAEYEYTLGRVEEGMTHLGECRRLRETLLALAPADLESRRLLADILKTQSYVTGDDSLSLELAGSALAMNVAYAAARPFSWRALMDLSYAHRNMGYAFLRLDRRDDSLAQMKACLRVRERMASADTLDLRAQHLVSDACHLVGDAFLKIGEADSALVFHRRGFSILSRLERMPDAPFWVGYEFIYSAGGLADACAAVGDTTSARTCYAKSLSSMFMSDATADMRFIRVQEAYAHFLFDIGDVAEAVRAHEACLEQTIAGMGEHLREAGASQGAWADLVAELCHIADFAAAHDPGMALDSARMATWFGEHHLGAGHPLTARAVALEAAILGSAGDMAAAKARYLELASEQPSCVIVCRPMARLARSKLDLIARIVSHDGAQRLPPPSSDSREWMSELSLLTLRNLLWGRHPWPGPGQGLD